MTFKPDESRDQIGKSQEIWDWLVHPPRSGGWKHRGGGALCFEWGFTRTFPGNQDVAVK